MKTQNMHVEARRAERSRSKRHDGMGMVLPSFRYRDSVGRRRLNSDPVKSGGCFAKGKAIKVAGKRILQPTQLIKLARVDAAFKVARMCNHGDDCVVFPVVPARTARKDHFALFGRKFDGEIVRPMFAKLL